MPLRELEWWFFLSAFKAEISFVLKFKEEEEKELFHLVFGPENKARPSLSDECSKAHPVARG